MAIEQLVRTVFPFYTILLQQKISFVQVRQSLTALPLGLVKAIGADNQGYYIVIIPPFPDKYSFIHIKIIYL